MKSACLAGHGKLDLLELPEPRISEKDEVLVRVKSCGICGSDVHYYRDGRIGDARCKYPHFIGHEPAGIVEEAPSGGAFKAGDRVAIEPGLPCGSCEWCTKGQYNLCPRVRFLASPGIQGAFQSHLCLKAGQLVRIPDSMGYDEAALLEPLGVAYHILAELAELQFGESVAIFGAGSIGLLTAALAKYYGASTVYITDPLEYRLQFAEAYCGADSSINPSRVDVSDAIMDMTHGRGVDVTVDAAGVQQSIDHTFACACIGGRSLLAGIPESDVIEYNPHVIRRKELRVLNVRRSNLALEPCIAIAEEGKLDLKPYITHNFKLDQIAEAFDVVSNYKDGVIKAMINP